MSSVLAVAAVSAVMKHLLLTSLKDSGVEEGVGNTASITILPVDKVPNDNPTINIYFYRSMVNPGWAANGLPSRDSRGERIANPLLAIDLHYLVTAHGISDYHGEMLLGYAMHVFHENPMLPRKLIRDALKSATLETTTTTESVRKLIESAGLAEQIEQIKITADPLSLDELSGVWSSLNTQHRPTAPYKVSVVLIESKRPARATLPVKDYTVTALPFNQPVITDVIAEDGPGTPVLATKKLVIKGQALRGGDTLVQFGTIQVFQEDLEFVGTDIKLSPPITLQCGVQTVQIKHIVPLGKPAVDHVAVESNVAAFVLQPLIQASGDEPPIEVISAGSPAQTKIQVSIIPPIASVQRAELLLYQVGSLGPSGPNVYRFSASSRDPDEAPVTKLEFPIPDVKLGTYLVRVRVDGAESPLELDTTLGYSGPKVSIT